MHELELLNFSSVKFDYFWTELCIGLSEKMETLLSLCKSEGSGVRSRRMMSPSRNVSQSNLIRNTILFSLLLLVQSVISLRSRNSENVVPTSSDNVEFNGKGKLKYVWGDALADPKAMGPDGNPYPWDLASKIASKQRNPRTLFAEEFGGADIGLINPETTRQILLKSFEAQEFGRGMNSFFGSLSHNHLHHGHHHSHSADESESTSTKRKGRSNRSGQSYTVRGRGNKRVNESPNNPYQQYQYHRSDAEGAAGTTSPPMTTSHPPPMPPTDGDVTSPPSEGGCVPSRLCPSTYNTTAPLYGISLTSGQPVTIVQKFPDLLQQVVFQVCKTTECDVIHGECVQTYLPYLFLVIPLGPVTLTGQDYVLVESGCVCRPKYASKQDEPPPLPFIQAYQMSNSTKGRRTHG